MRTAILFKLPAAFRFVQALRLISLPVLAAVFFGAYLLAAPAHKPVDAYKRPSAAHARHRAAVKPQATLAPLAALPATPPAPAWPVNEQATQAAVLWDSHGLRIDAANSSLRQILQDVATATGAKVEGMSNDERIFGVYGPGKAHDVILQLLHGSSYNVILIGDQGERVPWQIVLSTRQSGEAQPAANSAPATNNASDEDSDSDDQPATPTIRPGLRGQPRTLPQFTPEMQQRQLQRSAPPG
jgi:hypothetical protein